MQHNLQAQSYKEELRILPGPAALRQPDSAHKLMQISRQLKAKIRLLILSLALFGPLGNVFLSKGMRSVGPATSWKRSELLNEGLRVVGSGYIWLGIASLLTFFIAYMLVLTYADYSYVQPASSIAYFTVAVLGYFALGEAITPLRWTGIGTICLGVFIVGRTAPRTTKGS